MLAVLVQQGGALSLVQSNYFWSGVRFVVKTQEIYVLHLAKPGRARLQFDGHRRPCQLGRLALALEMRVMVRKSSLN